MVPFGGSKTYSFLFGKLFESFVKSFRAGSTQNRELSRLLVYLNWPTVIDKTLAKMREESTPPPENNRRTHDFRKKIMYFLTKIAFFLVGGSINK